MGAVLLAAAGLGVSAGTRSLLVDFSFELRAG